MIVGDFDGRSYESCNNHCAPNKYVICLVDCAAASDQPHVYDFHSTAMRRHLSYAAVSEI